MKLRTLKDLCNDANYPKDGSCLQLRDELRKEAIRWIKHIREHLETSIDNCKICDTYWMDEDASGAIDVLRKFFNITEEELK
jgi:hypothetical protein